jgi:hypothetical protein
MTVFPVLITFLDVNDDLFVVTPCGFVGGYQCLQGTYQLSFQVK